MTETTQPSNTTDTTETTQANRRSRPSPALVIFLVFPVLGLLAACVVMLSSAPASQQTPATPMPVTLAPPKVLADAPMIDFTLTALDGETVSLSDYNGRIVFLNFWATWCTPCKKELPAFQQFQAQQPADGPVILAVDVGETPEQVRGFLDEFGVTGLKILLDPDLTASDSYGIFNMPTTFVIDRSGVVSYIKYGETTIDDLYTYLDALNGA
ncbi:MAG: redoxin domain-containing protein [Anaerolineae bacterium]|nr:redoxin domain-containing protein [Anaerolineae bacterium]